MTASKDSRLHTGHVHVFPHIAAGVCQLHLVSEMT